MKHLNKAILIPLMAISLSGCGLLPGGGGDGGSMKPVDSSALPSEIEPEEGEEYYKADDISLWLECSGYYTSMSYFYLDEENPNQRVYDNLYFYEKDYFFCMSKNMKDWYAKLSDNHDTTYVEEELAEGEEYHIDIKADGIYTVKFDMETKRFDVIYKAEIVTPKFYEIKKCQVLSNSKYTQMEANPANPDELQVKNIELNHAKGITFYQTPNRFRVTIDPASTGVVSIIGKTRDDYISVNIDGAANLYLNRKTYVARAELVDPDQTTFKFTTLNDAKDALIVQEPAHPYLFTYDLVVENAYTAIDDLSFYDFHVNKYEFNLISGGEYLREYTSPSTGKTYLYYNEAGTYRLSYDVLHLTMGIERLPS